MTVSNLKLARVLRDQEITAAYKAGADIITMSIKYGLSPGSIVSIANKIDKTRRGRKQAPELTERNEKLCAFYLAGNSLELTGHEFGMTRERARQILVKCNKFDRHYHFGSTDRVAARERKAAQAALRAKKREAIAARRAAIRADYEAGATYEEMATKYGVAISLVQADIWHTGGPNKNHNARKPKRRLSDDDRLVIAKKWATGGDRFAIAAEFEVAPSYVPMIALKLGFHRSHPRNMPAVSA